MQTKLLDIYPKVLEKIQHLYPTVQLQCTARNDVNSRNHQNIYLQQGTFRIGDNINGTSKTNSFRRGVSTHTGAHKSFVYSTVYSTDRIPHYWCWKGSFIISVYNKGPIEVLSTMRDLQIDKMSTETWHLQNCCRQWFRIDLQKCSLQ